MGDVKDGHGGTDHLGAIAVWLTGASVLAYVFSSYSLRGYFRLIAENVNKTLEILSR